MKVLWVSLLLCLVHRGSPSVDVSVLENAMEDIAEIYKDLNEHVNLIKDDDITQTPLSHRFKQSQHEKYLDVHCNLVFLGFPSTAVKAMKEKWFDSLDKVDKLYETIGTDNRRYHIPGRMSAKYHFHVIQTSFHVTDILRAHFNLLLRPYNTRTKSEDKVYYLNLKEVEVVLNDLSQAITKDRGEYHQDSPRNSNSQKPPRHPEPEPNPDPRYPTIFILHLDLKKQYVYLNSFSQDDLHKIAANPEARDLLHQAGRILQEDDFAQSKIKLVIEPTEHIDEDTWTTAFVDSHPEDIIYSSTAGHVADADDDDGIDGGNEYQDYTYYGGEADEPDEPAEDHHIPATHWHDATKESAEWAIAFKEKQHDPLRQHAKNNVSLVKRVENMLTDQSTYGPLGHYRNSLSAALVKRKHEQEQEQEQEQQPGTEGPRDTPLSSAISVANNGFVWLDTFATHHLHAQDLAEVLQRRELNIYHRRGAGGRKKAKAKAKDRSSSNNNNNNNKIRSKLREDEDEESEDDDENASLYEYDNDDYGEDEDTDLKDDDDNIPTDDAITSRDWLDIGLTYSKGKSEENKETIVASKIDLVERHLKAVQSRSRQCVLPAGFFKLEEFDEGNGLPAGEPKPIADRVNGLVAYISRILEVSSEVMVCEELYYQNVLLVALLDTTRQLYATESAADDNGEREKSLQKLDVGLSRVLEASNFLQSIQSRYSSAKGGDKDRDRDSTPLDAKVALMSAPAISYLSRLSTLLLRLMREVVIPPMRLRYTPDRTAALLDTLFRERTDPHIWQSSMRATHKNILNESIYFQTSPLLDAIRRDLQTSPPMQHQHSRPGAYNSGGEDLPNHPLGHHRTSDQDVRWWTSLLPTPIIPTRVEVTIYVVYFQHTYEVLQGADGPTFTGLEAFDFKTAMGEIARLRLPHQRLTIDIHRVNSTDEAALGLAFASCIRKVRSPPLDTPGMTRGDARAKLKAKAHLRKLPTEYLDAECILEHVRVGPTDGADDTGRGGGGDSAPLYSMTETTTSSSTPEDKADRHMGKVEKRWREHKFGDKSGSSGPGLGLRSDADVKQQRKYKPKQKPPNKANSLQVPIFLLSMDLANPILLNGFQQSAYVGSTIVAVQNRQKVVHVANSRGYLHGSMEGERFAHTSTDTHLAHGRNPVGAVLRSAAAVIGGLGSTGHYSAPLAATSSLPHVRKESERERGTEMSSTASISTLMQFAVGDSSTLSIPFRSAVVGDLPALGNGAEEPTEPRGAKGGKAPVSLYSGQTPLSYHSDEHTSTEYCAPRFSAFDVEAVHRNRILRYIGLLREEAWLLGRSMGGQTGTVSEADSLGYDAGSGSWFEGEGKGREWKRKKRALGDGGTQRLFVLFDEQVTSALWHVGKGEWMEALRRVHRSVSALQRLQKVGRARALLHLERHVLGGDSDDRGDDRGDDNGEKDELDEAKDKGNSRYRWKQLKSRDRDGDTEPEEGDSEENEVVTLELIFYLFFKFVVVSVIAAIVSFLVTSSLVSRYILI